jgi:hypothetical protein
MTDAAKQLTLEQFLAPAIQTGLTQQRIDAHIDSIQGATQVKDRELLRACFYVLRAIGVSMPWDEVQGLDARRVDTRLGGIVPTWRECIGALLHIEFSPPAPEEPQDPDAETALD